MSTVRLTTSRWHVVEVAMAAQKKPVDPGSEHRSDPMKEMLLGTWMAIALLGKALTDSGLVDSDELIEVFGTAEHHTRNMDERYRSFRAVRVVLERLVENPDDDPGDGPDGPAGSGTGCQSGRRKMCASQTPRG